ncbi:class I SAM-dependent methyltransferase [Halioglobus pacificus]|uniref:class I SAM-dependent methyltransferase n=1 Tax=Parahalioglobus pacificus TaxID=930806 RepID=UPI00167BE1C6|nr:class I SAM-dependent methyltransferase [Halioglobus pacificus]
MSVIGLEAFSSTLIKRDDGIWHSDTSREISYPVDGHAACAQVEAESFWFNHRNECIAAMIDNHPPAEGGPIFDVGGGNGWVTLHMQNCGYDSVLVEPGIAGCQTAISRGVENVVCSTTDDAEFSSNSVPAIGLFDVIEHLPDDVSFLDSICSLMCPGAKLYATVPAYPRLWSQEDVVAGHHRRYTLDTFCKLLESTGFEVLYSTYIFRFLPVPILLLRTVPFRLGIAPRNSSPDNSLNDHTTRSSIKSRAIDFALAGELANIRSNKKMSFGGSCMVVAIKR